MPRESVCYELDDWLVDTGLHVPRSSKYVDHHQCYSDIEPSHASTEPSHSDTEPSHSNTEPNHSNTEPNHSNTEPSHSDTSHSKTEPSHSNTEPSHSKTEPSHSNIEPSCTIRSVSPSPAYQIQKVTRKKQLLLIRIFHTFCSDDLARSLIVPLVTKKVLLINVQTCYAPQTDTNHRVLLMMCGSSDFSISLMGLPIQQTTATKTTTTTTTQHYNNSNK